MWNRKEWLVCSKNDLETKRKQSPFCGPHSWTSARQTLHLVKFVAHACVRLSGSFVIDWLISSGGSLFCSVNSWGRELVRVGGRTDASAWSVPTPNRHLIVTQTALIVKMQLSGHCCLKCLTAVQPVLGLQHRRPSFLHAEGEPWIVSIWQWSLGQLSHWTSEKNFSEARKIAALSFDTASTHVEPKWQTMVSTHQIKSNDAAASLDDSLAELLTLCALEVSCLCWREERSMGVQPVALCE